MRNVWLLGLVGVAACGLTEEKFIEQYNERACDELEVCVEGASCPSVSTELPGCDFDKDKAQQCLDGDWVCDAENNIVIPHVSCLTVCGSGSVDTDGE